MTGFLPESQQQTDLHEAQIQQLIGECRQMAQQQTTNFASLIDSQPVVRPADLDTPDMKKLSLAPATSGHPVPGELSRPSLASPGLASPQFQFPANGRLLTPLLGSNGNSVKLCMDVEGKFCMHV